jgi:Uroporphyrinogen decarboxylase (URO-D)
MSAAGTAATTMTAGQRFLETLTFGTPDRIPFQPGGARRSTLEAWHGQGLDPNVPYMEAVYRSLGIERQITMPKVQPGVNFKMLPTFEEKILEHKNGHYIVQDWMGNITEISDKYDYTYIRQAIDFVTRKWHKFPVESPEDFEENMRWRYQPDQVGRYPQDLPERIDKMRGRDYVTKISISGPFWQLREWCGFEPLCMMFIDQPEFIKEMISFWTDFISRTMAPLLTAGVIDVLAISEDMAYKEKSMISPAMTREFLQPSYDRWVSEARAGGVKIIDMDSDGKIDELIPIWIESGINVCDPIEVAAGNDLDQYRQTFGRKMAYSGGVDKRAMAKGGKIIEAELARLEPVVRSGGYIPGCDHGVPPDVSWPDFLHYCRLLAEMTGWL